MTISFRPAVRGNEWLLLAIAGPTGSGKTRSALRIARGLVGPQGKIAGIDTENGRMLHHAPYVQFDHGRLDAPFTPARYLEAVDAAVNAGYNAVVVDSASHEWAGDGGCQDMHDAALQRMAGDDYRKAERMSALAWRDPKREHKRLMSKLIQRNCHLLFCLRADQKLKIVKGADGKMQYVDAGFQPICEKHFMYEMTFSMLLSADKPGTFSPIKMPGEFADIFRQGDQLTEKHGEALAAWARGESAAKVAEKPAQAPAALANDLVALLGPARDVADLGIDRLREHLKSLTKEQRAVLKPEFVDLESRARSADNATRRRPDGERDRESFPRLGDVS